MRRFVGSGVFCVKLCYNNITKPDYCLNIYDLVGCDYNMPNNLQNNTYTSCEGDLQEVVGVYSVNGTRKYLFHLLVTLVVTFFSSYYLVDASDISGPSSLPA